MKQLATQLKNNASAFGSRAKRFAAPAIAAGTVMLFSANSYADLTELTDAASTELATVKVALLAIGVILLGIAALTYGIYKVLSMAGGRK